MSPLLVSTVPKVYKYLLGCILVLVAWLVFASNDISNEAARARPHYLPPYYYIIIMIIMIIIIIVIVIVIIRETFVGCM